MKNHTAKRAILPILVLLTIWLTGCISFPGTADDTVISEQFEYGIKKFSSQCFVCSYNWDGNKENMDVVIPDSYNGKRVTALGGYLCRGYPMPFIHILKIYRNEVFIK